MASKWMPGALRRARASDSAATPSRRTSSVVGARLVAAGELDQVADERAELLALLDDVGEQAPAILGLELDLLEQDLDVGAQARHRRAQLVRGVGDELALGADGLVERLARGLQAVEHRVEVGGELADLVVGVDVDAPGEVVGLADLLGDLGHLGQRRQHPAGRPCGRGPRRVRCPRRSSTSRTSRRSDRTLSTPLSGRASWMATFSWTRLPAVVVAERQREGQRAAGGCRRRGRRRGTACRGRRRPARAWACVGRLG